MYFFEISFKKWKAPSILIQNMYIRYHLDYDLFVILQRE